MKTILTENVTVRKNSNMRWCLEIVDDPSLGEGDLKHYGSTPEKAQAALDRKIRGWYGAEIRDYVDAQY